MTFALVGNPNGGKTTLFNRLTGARQHVGNFPGVTVERKWGQVRGAPSCAVMDLPGIYSLRPYSPEERITREVLIRQRPEGIMNVVDAASPQRSLYLTAQLMELRLPMVVVLNRMDEVRGNGGRIDVAGLERARGVPVVPVSAARGEGVALAVERMAAAIREQCIPPVPAPDGARPVQDCLETIAAIVGDRAEQLGVSRRFCAAGVLEDDPELAEKLGLCPAEQARIRRTITAMETRQGTDRHAALAAMRYAFAEQLCGRYIKPGGESREHRRSRRIDRVLTHRVLALPVFFLMMLVVFWLTFHVVGAVLSRWLAAGMAALTAWADDGLTAAGVAPAVHSLVIDGLFAGVGSVLSFLPVILTLFFFLSVLEDTGYMARVAFVMDRPLRKIGLSGRCFVPMLIGFGCTVPAVMACRTLASRRDRNMTILLLPYVSCSAKIPIYAVFCASFFPRRAPLVMLVLYVGGMGLGVLAALFFKSSLLPGDGAPLVMELPDYRLPSPRSVLLLMGQKARDFVQKAFTVVFLAAVVIWFLRCFDPSLRWTTDSSRSLLCGIGRLAAPLFRPLGFGDWRAVTALLAGLTAKEAVVSTLGVLLDSGAQGLHAALVGVFTPASAASFLVFTLLYTPCAAAMATVRRELGSVSKTLGLMAFQCGVAWVAAGVTYDLARLFQ